MKRWFLFMTGDGGGVEVSEQGGQEIGGSVEGSPGASGLEYLTLSRHLT